MLAELETGVSVKQMIERVPLGARVPALNPLRWDYDSTFAEPNESSWAKLTLVMRKRDGGVVDAELLRPRAWIEAAGIAVGKPLPLNLPELNIRDEVSVTAIEACPPIASGAGSVVTARFVTREAHLVASVQLRGPGGELETLTGTELHPIWSADRADWIPLSQLQPGERLLCSHPSTSWDGESERGQAHAIVLGVTLSTVCEPVYNLEIHGEHVYQVGELGVLVHNGTPAHCPLESINAPKSTAAVSNAVNPRLTARLDAFRSYRANGGTMDMARWVKATQGNPAYGTGFKSGFADWSRRVGQPVHGNSLAAQGAHDVYVLREAGSGRLLHFGETGRGYLTRFAEHQRDYARLGIDIEVDLLRTVEGKAAARAWGK
jgi:hypothetical protein